MSNHDDAAFVRNFSMVLVGLAVIGVMAFVLAKIVNRSFQETQDADANAVTRVAPMGQVNTGSEPVTVETPVEAPASAAPAAAPAAAVASGDIGQATYDKVCFACHAQGIAGAPKQGDMAAWEARIGKGTDTLYQNAINGFTGNAGMMPAKGGNPSLSDDEVRAAVDYMLAAVGGGDSSAAAPAPAAAPEAAAEPAPAVADSGRGKEVYDSACTVCHAVGAAGAPKLGDTENWGPRLAKGTDKLYHNAINGYMGESGLMPPKGGRPDFSDDDVKAAVDYMVSAAQ